MPILRRPSNCRCSLWFPYECGGGSVLSRGRFVSGETVCVGGVALPLRQHRPFHACVGLLYIYSINKRLLCESSLCNEVHAVLYVYYITTHNSNWIFHNVVRIRAAKFQEPYFLCWLHTANVSRFITAVAAYVNLWLNHTLTELRKLHANCTSLCALKRRRSCDETYAAGAAININTHTHTHTHARVCMCLSTENHTKAVMEVISALLKVNLVGP